MTTTPDTIVTGFVVQVGGSPLAEELMDLLDEVVVDDHRWLPDVVELRFHAPEVDVVDQITRAVKVGDKLKVGAEAAAVQWLTEVEVTAVELMFDEDGGTTTLVRGYDSSHRLQRGRKVRSFLKLSVGDIAKKVVSEAGVPLGSVESGPVIEEIVQPNISDWDFLQRLAGDFGFEVVVDQGKVGIGKPVSPTESSTLTCTLGENVLSLRVAISAAEQVGDVQVRAWDPKTKQAVVGKSKTSSSTSAARIAIAPKDLAKPFGARTLTVCDVPHVVDQGALTTMATGFAEQIARTCVDVELVVRGDATARSGSVVTIEGAGSQVSGTYVVTSARHVLQRGEYTTTLVVSGRRDSTLVGLVAGSDAPVSHVVGLVPGIVTNIQDPDKKGRVKVKLPWLEDTFETDWARTLQLGGAKGGGMVLPEVNDEVLVGFDQGRLECPYVLGGLYNGKDGPGTGAVADVDSGSGAVSRRSFADRDGNRIELIKAGNGDKGIRVTTGDDKFSLYFDGKAQTIKIDSAGKVEIASKTDLNLAATGNVSIEAKGNLTLKATGNLDAEATGNIKAKATGQFQAEGMATTIKGNTTVSVQGTASAEIKGGATTTISGALVKIN